MHAGLLLAGCKAHLKDPGSGTPAKRQLLAFVLLECMQQPRLRSEACSQLVRGIADGHFGSREVSAMPGLLTSTQFRLLQDYLQFWRHDSMTALLIVAVLS